LEDLLLVFYTALCYLRRLETLIGHAMQEIDTKKAKAQRELQCFNLNQLMHIHNRAKEQLILKFPDAKEPRPSHLMAFAFLEAFKLDPAKFIWANDLSALLNIRYDQARAIVQSSKKILLYRYELVLYNKTCIGHRIATAWETLCEAIKSDHRSMAHHLSALKRAFNSRSPIQDILTDDQLAIADFVQGRIRQIQKDLASYHELVHTLPYDLQNLIDDIGLRGSQPAHSAAPDASRGGAYVERQNH
jgi:hypothetical protein